jgi:hypothetical protein
MNKTVWVYGFLLGVLVVVLKLLEYKWLIRDLNWQASVALVTVVFMGMEFWVSQRLNRTNTPETFAAI